MRKNIIMAVLASALLCLSQIMSAVPAKPGKVNITQPDGSSLTIIVHGDEWFHYVTDENGNILEENNAGFFVKSSTTFEALEAKMVQAQKAKEDILQQRSETIAKAQAIGSPYIPVILVEFKDKKFSITDPKTSFEKLLTEKDYGKATNTGTGSVCDYYYDQSRGQFTPKFVVMEVVTLANNMSTYGSTDTNAARALYEACQALDATVDFSIFDNDHNGKIDMALMYYAGYNEAEGASSATIWPHQGYAGNYVSNMLSFDGVKLDRYFCTSELKGTSGTRMCGIGTTCHEFAHSLGLPDFYDTNYNNYGDGEAGGTYTYDVMCSGSYNNSGMTPPWMGAEELTMLGWADPITSLTTTGTVTIPAISADAPVAYKSATSADGEYFLYECRPGTGWDAPLTPGLIIYHVDKSPSHTITWKYSSTQSRSATAYNLWANWTSYNAINCNGSHPCYYIIPAGNQTSLNYTSGSNFAFPGYSSVTTYTPIDWAGSDTGFSLSQIAFNSSTKEVTFNMVNSNTCNVSGFVLDSDGMPLAGATVVVTGSSATSSSKKKGTQIDLMGNRSALLAPADGGSQATVTDENGAYTITLDGPGTYILQASLEGYVTKSATIEISRPTTQNFYLLREGEQAPSEIHTYADDQDLLGVGNSEYSSWDIMVADNFPASLIGAYVGKQIKTLSFMIDGETDTEGATTTTGNVYGLVDMGEEKILLPVENPLIGQWNDIDISEYDLLIPDGKDIYAGYAMEGWGYSYPIVSTKPKDASLTGYLADLDLTGANWEWEILDSYVFVIKLTIGDYVQYGTGYNFIDEPNGGEYTVGSTFNLSIIETESERRPNAAGVSWFYDDEPVSGTSVVLDEIGEHTITAKFTTESGTQKVIDHQVKVVGTSSETITLTRVYLN